MTVKHFIPIMGGVKIDGILAEIEANPQLWDRHTARKTAPGGPHSQVSDIWIRYNDVAPFESGERPWPELSNEHVPIWYPEVDSLPSLKPVILDLMAIVRGEMLGGVIITKVPDGCVVDPHIDQGWHVDYYEKFYLQLKNSPGSTFSAFHDGKVETIEPVPGEIWLFDNHKIHWVENKSGDDRITVMIAIKTDVFGRYDEKLS